ncbi:unnamed protein product [Arabidopsis halleri]
MPFGFRHFSLFPSDLGLRCLRSRSVVMVSTWSKRAEEAHAFFASQSAVVFRKTKKAKAVHKSLAEESRCRITIPDSSNSDTTATIGEGNVLIMYLYVLPFFSKGSSPRSPTSTSGSNIDKTITSSSHSLSRKDVPDSADRETSVAGVLSSSTVGEKVRNHNILINKLKQKTLVIHGFPIAIQLMLFQSIPLLLRYLPSSDDAQTFYDMSLSVLPTLKTYHTNNILLLENDKDLIVSQSVVSTEEDCVSVGDPKVSHMLSLIRRGYRFSKGDWRGGDASLGKSCICDKKKYCRCNCGPDSSPPNACTPAPVLGHLPSNADSEAIAKLTAEVAHLKNMYAELYVKLKADVVVELKSFLEERTCGSCSRNCGVCAGVPASRADSLSAAVVDTLKPVSSSKPVSVYGCVENRSKDVTVNPESRLQTVDPSFQLSVREDDVPSNLQEILGTDLISEVPNQLVTAHASGGLCSGHLERVVPINYVLIDSSPVPLDELPPQLAQKYLKPMKGRTKRGMIASTRCNVNKSPKRQKQGLPGHVDYIPFHPVPQRLSATFKKQLLAYCKLTFWRKRGSYLAAQGIILLDSLFTQLLCSQYSNFVNAAAPSAFLWDPLVASYIEGAGGDRTERTTWFKDVNTVYVPMNWGNRHWVGLVICLKSSHIDILDPYLECSSDNEVATYMEPLVTMLPHLLKASCDPTDIGILLDSPFSYHRVEGLPQNTRTGDCGPFVMKLIEMHSHNFSVGDMGHIPDAKVDIFRMEVHAAIEIYRRVAETSFTVLAPLLLVGKKQSKLAFSDAVLSSLSLHEFFNNPELANEGSAFRSFFLKCVAANNPVANYLESLRIVAQHGDVSHAIAMLYSAVPESDYITFARGMFLIVAQFPCEGIATISSLFTRLGTVAQVDAIGTVVFRHLSIFRPLRRRLFSNLLVLDSIPVCVGNACNLQNRCLNCFMYWFIIRLNYVL